MSDEPTGLILRFRDLVTPEGETIRRHKVIADTNGFVWWGWWHKSGEQPAIRATRALNTHHSGGVPILLLDSGRSRLHRARCLEFRYDHVRFDRIDSPDPAATPDYYSAQSYYGWYKLTDFEDVIDTDAESVLRSLTYVQVDEFFAEESSPFRAFYGKRIYDIAELVQQNRTVWFTRDARTGDPSHRIELLNAEHSRPTHFGTQYYSRLAGRRSRRILWLSDLHFSMGEHHAFPYEHDVNREPLWLALTKALRDNDVHELAGVIISGDITWKADPEEFGKARDFMERLSREFTLDPRQLGVCPGNHDVAFSQDPASKDAPATVATSKARRSYEEFYNDLFYHPPNAFMSSGRRWLVGGALPVDVVLLNSSLLQQHPDFEKTDLGRSTPVFQGQGFLGQAQLDDAAKEFAWDDAAFSRLRALRVVVLHHHIVPVTFSEAARAGANYSVVLDAERLTRWLVKHRVDVVLHGHQHQPFTTRLVRPARLEEDGVHHSFTVLGMGSSGVSLDHLGEEKRNTFALLEFGDDAISVEFWSIHPTNPSKRMYSLNVPYMPAQ